VSSQHQATHLVKIDYGDVVRRHDLACDCVHVLNDRVALQPQGHKRRRGDVPAKHSTEMHEELCENTCGNVVETGFALRIHGLMA
jgi:hypothetical protein